MDVHLDVSKSGYAGRLNVIEGPTGRRQRTNIEKARIAAESLKEGCQYCGDRAPLRDHAVADLRLAQAATRRTPGC